ncbi:hypothetical protein IB232_13620 [Pseudomonas sp. PDM15]|nr:hypothetical protein [Pseudomonas sp. PDM15]
MIASLTALPKVFRRHPMGRLRPCLHGSGAKWCS